MQLWYWYNCIYAGKFNHSYKTSKPSKYIYTYNIPQTFTYRVVSASMHYLPSNLFLPAYARVSVVCKYISMYVNTRRCVNNRDDVRFARCTQHAGLIVDFAYISRGQGESLREMCAQAFRKVRCGEKKKKKKRVRERERRLRNNARVPR